LPDQIPCRLLLKISPRIEPLGGVADHHFRLIESMHIEKDKDLAEMVLRRAVPTLPVEAPMNGDGFVSPGVVD
jgi:hypothetical protein